MRTIIIHWQPRLSDPAAERFHPRMSAPNSLDCPIVVRTRKDASVHQDGNLPLGIQVVGVARGIPPSCERAVDLIGKRAWDRLPACQDPQTSIAKCTQVAQLTGWKPIPRLNRQAASRES